jgi:hypothetical protein
MDIKYGSATYNKEFNDCINRGEKEFVLIVEGQNVQKLFESIDCFNWYWAKTRSFPKRGRWDSFRVLPTYIKYWKLWGDYGFANWHGYLIEYEQKDNKAHIIFRKP